jgi:hypothetical protein
MTYSRGVHGNPLKLSDWAVPTRPPWAPHLMAPCLGGTLRMGT